jgi:hypothetical protein
MTNGELSGLILAITKVLYVNGQATDQVVSAGRQLGDKLGLRADLCRAGASCSCVRWVEARRRSRTSRRIQPVSI